MFNNLQDFIGAFIFFYPICASILWCISSIYFFFRRERKADEINPHEERFDMGISVIIPAHNEESCIVKTVESVLKSKYDKFEILIVDDASTDKTLSLALSLSDQYENVRVIALKQNKGKPMALNLAAAAARYEILLVMDADTLLEEDAMAYMAIHFKYGPRVGAVTGNPRVRNRNSLIEKIQVAEYCAIIGMIKRAQRILGKLFTVSGAIVAFRKSAIFDVGLWDIDMITDDINITWKLEKRFWDIRYETQALCWTEVPNSLTSLWKQRLRWAQGGCEVIFKHFNIWTDIRQRRFWPVYIEYFISILWAYTFILSLLGAFLPIFIPDIPINFSWMNGWYGFFLTIMCFIQFFIAISMDSMYEKNLWKYMFYTVIYAIIYWFIIVLTILVELPKFFFCGKSKVATWNSPARKIKEG